jgi:hypothetical protein
MTITTVLIVYIVGAAVITVGVGATNGGEDLETKEAVVIALWPVMLFLAVALLFGRLIGNIFGRKPFA